MSKRSVRIFAFALVLLALSAGAVQASRLVSFHSQASASLGPNDQVQPTATATATATVTVTPEPAGQEVEISGTVSAIAGDVYTIDGKSVLVNAQTRISGSPVVGDTVKVEAALQPDGSLLAIEIEKTESLLTTPEAKPTEMSEKEDNEDDVKPGATSTPGVTSTPGAKQEDDQDEHGSGTHPVATLVPGAHMEGDHESESGKTSRQSGSKHKDGSSGNHDD